MDDLTLPVRVVQTSVYTTIVDDENRLVTFIAASLKSKAIANLIAKLMNESANNDRQT